MRIKELLEHAPIMVAIVEGHDHVITFANTTYLQALGATADIVGMPVRQAFADSYQQHADHLFEYVRQTGEPLLDYERHLHIRRGKARVSAYFNFAFQPVTNAQGNVQSVCLYGIDVTSQVQARRRYRQDKQRQIDAQTAQLRQQNDELKELNTTKDEFIALASHQLRTPATGVKQYLGMVLEGYVGPVTPAQEEFLQQAYASNERQLNTINDLLQIAQIDANKIILNRQACDVNETVREVVAEQRSNIKRRRQTVRVVQHAKPALVWADQLRLRMVLDNLVDNASKYSRERTTITISVTAERQWVRIAIADEGVGIDSADFDKLFQKFTRIDNPLSIVVGGNGLGLYLVKKLVDAHGGDIAVESAVYRGTVFTLTLPTPPAKAKV